VKDFRQCRLHVTEHIDKHMRLLATTTLRVFSVIEVEVTSQQYKQVAITAALHGRRAFHMISKCSSTLRS